MADNQVLHASPGTFFLIAGPCVIEDTEMGMHIGRAVQKICRSLDIPYVFKASYRKANRSSVRSFTGIGDEKALAAIGRVGAELGIRTTTDIHTEAEADMAAAYVDVLQIPAFLCRQTALLLAAGRTGKTVNIKKGQFMSANAMQFAVEKVRSTGNSDVWLTERGTMFGYQDLVVDFRSVPAMQRFQTPVVVDCTHALQQPNQAAGVTGGQPELIATIAKAAVATGADGLFIETHPDPANAKSDGANMLPLDQLEALLRTLVAIRRALADT